MDTPKVGQSSPQDIRCWLQDGPNFAPRYNQVAPTSPSRSPRPTKTRLPAQILNEVPRSCSCSRCIVKALPLHHGVFRQLRVVFKASHHLSLSLSHEVHVRIFLAYRGMTARRDYKPTPYTSVWRNHKEVPTAAQIVIPER